MVEASLTTELVPKHCCKLYKKAEKAVDYNVVVRDRHGVLKGKVGFHAMRTVSSFSS